MIRKLYLYDTPVDTSPGGDSRISGIGCYHGNQLCGGCACTCWDHGDAAVLEINRQSTNSHQQETASELVGYAFVYMGSSLAGAFTGFARRR